MPRNRATFRLFLRSQLMSRARTTIFGTLCAAAAVCALPAFAQYPGHIDPTQQNNTGQPHLRATAVLEYTGDLGKDMKASRLIPIAVWDGTTYQPGSLYLAEPAPLAVQTGTQYELESAGKPTGFFNINVAEMLQGTWVGAGSYQALVAPTRPKPKNSSHMPYQVRDTNTDPDKPHFAHRPADESSQSGDSGNGGNTGQSGQTAQPVDPDRPTLHNRTGSSSGGGTSDSGSSGSGTSASNQPQVDPDRPTFHRRAEASSGGGDMTSSQPVDPNRPHLGYTTPTEQEKLDKPDTLSGMPEDLKQVAGVSDERPLDTENYTFSWANPDDEGKMKAALEDIAQKAIAPPAPAAPAAKTPAVHVAATHRKVAPPPPPPALADEEFHAYSLSFGGGATMVLTARTADAPYKYVTVVAQPDFYGQPQVLLKQVTSDNQMDAIPRMRLVDAVDTAGTGRADLIFEMRGRTYRQFAIYRIAGGTATKAFETQATAD